MREISNKLAVSLIVLAIVLSVIFTFGIMQNFPANSNTQVNQAASGPSGGEVSLTFTKPLKPNHEEGGEVSLTLLPAGG